MKRSNSTKEQAAPTQLAIKMMAVKDLHPYAKNPRKNDAAIERMVASIREYGFRIPVIAKSDGTVVDGHLRLKAAQAMGMQEVPVVFADELTDAQVKAFRLLVNQSANWAQWDEDLLKGELEELKALDVDIDSIGFPEDFLEQLLEPAKEDGGVAPGKLAELFGLPPFSVMSAREGWWQDRKCAWIDLGVDSVEGRGNGNLLKFSKTVQIVLHKPC